MSGAGFGFFFLHRHSSRSSRRPFVSCVSWMNPRSLSSSSSATTASFSSSATTVVTNDLPTRHSWKQPPKICHDLAELEETTATILDQSVGSLYAATATSGSSPTTSFDSTTPLKGQRSQIYDAADPTIQLVEYLIRGHSSKLQGSMYSNYQGKEQEESSSNKQKQLQHLDSIKKLLQRMHDEGSMYMRLRQEALKLNEEDDSSSISDNSSSSSDSNADDDNDDATLLEFAPPGATMTMYDSVLDAMAVIPENSDTVVDPLDIFHTTMQALSANDLDIEHNFDDSKNEKSRLNMQLQQHNKYTLATPITYNAALRGLLSNTDFKDPKQRDNALNGAFGLYNHLTHSRHLVRNTASILYMVQIVNEALPGSRVKGNISVTLWKQACQFGVITPELAQAVQAIHGENASCGPEFDIFLKQLDTPMNELPQRYRRFAKKYKHSKHY